MADYTVGDFLGQDSTEYLVTQLLLKIKAVRDMLSGITHIDVQIANEVPVNPPAHPDTTLYIVLVSGDSESGDLFTEYIWVVQSQTWERVGKAQVDLTDYAKKTDIGNATLTIKVGDITLGTFNANAKSDATITLDLTAYALKTDIGDATLTIKQGQTTLGTFKANSKTNETIIVPEPDLSDYASKTDIGDATLTIKIGNTILGTFKANAKTDSTITIDLSDYAQTGDIGDATLTLKQGDAILGTFKANAKTDAIISIPEPNLTGYARLTDIGDATLTIRQGNNILGSFKANSRTDADITIPEIDLSDYASKSDIGDATLTIKLGDTILGTFKANSKTNAEITVPEVDLSDYALKSYIGDATLTIKLGNTVLGTFTANSKTDAEIVVPEVDLSGYALKSDIGDATLTIKQGNTTLGTFKANSKTDGTITIDLSDYAQLSDVGDATITLKQGNTTLGTFTTNSKTDTTINIPAGSAAAEAWNDGDPVAHSKTTLASMPVTITDGTIRVAVDTLELYLDTNGNRIRIGDYIILADDAERLALQNPIESKLYMVESTHCLWSYKSGWWSLLSYGDLLRRNVLVSTFPVALGSNSSVDQGAQNNWVAHGTMIQVPEMVYLTSDMKFKAIITQLPSSLEYDVYVIPAIYKYIGPDLDDYGIIRCSLVAAGNAEHITKIGWQEFTFNRGTQQYLDPQEVYFYVYLHNMNGLGMPGYYGTQMNDPPYVSWINGNLGQLEVAPNTLELQSESTLRLFGSFYANGATQT